MLVCIAVKRTHLLGMHGSFTLVDKTRQKNSFPTPDCFPPWKPICRHGRVGLMTFLLGYFFTCLLGATASCEQLLAWNFVSIRLKRETPLWITGSLEFMKDWAARDMQATMISQRLSSPPTNMFTAYCSKNPDWTIQALHSCSPSKKIYAYAVPARETSKRGCSNQTPLPLWSRVYWKWATETASRRMLKWHELLWTLELSLPKNNSTTSFLQAWSIQRPYYVVA